jgi:purine-binding chemotaxis protein CheW
MSNTACTTAAARGVAEFLSFTVGDGAYGIAIAAVQELRGYGPVTRLANAPPEVKGVMNLRGLLVPVIDLRIRLGVAEVRYDDTTVVVVLQDGSRTLGAVVDGVSDVIALAPDDIRPAPDVANEPGRRGIVGIGLAAGAMLVLLDVGAVLAGCGIEPAMAALEPSLHLA